MTKGLMALSHTRTLVTCLDYNKYAKNVMPKAMQAMAKREQGIWILHFTAPKGSAAAKLGAVCCHLRKCARVF